MDGGSGYCLCGAVRFSFDGPPNWQAHCHCESCRRNCAAPFTSFLGISHGNWRWTGKVPKTYTSSPGVTRHFCGTCGTPMAYQGDRWPHEMHFYATTLDDPSAYQPSQHVNWNEHLPWVRIDDGLPVRRTPRQITGSENLTPLLNMIRKAFAYMDGVVDPPSSIHRLTEPGIVRQAKSDGEVWVIDEGILPVACIFMTPKPDRLYIGKLAVADAYRHQGIARQLLDLASKRAALHGLNRLELECRVELVANHAFFESSGFVRTGETTHESYDRPTSFTFTKTLN